MSVKGATTRSFTMASAEVVKITLTAFGAGVPVGVGVGIPATSAPCSLAQSVVTTPASPPQIVINADAGAYCAEVFDVGGLTGDAAFTLTVEHR